MANETLRVYINSICVVCTFVGWSYLIVQPAGWLKKVTPLYSLDASLWSAQTSEGVISLVAGRILGAISADQEHVLKNMQKRSFELQEFREYMCSYSRVQGFGRVCTIWEQIQMSTWALVFMVMLTLALFATGGGLECYHQFVRARQETRKWVQTLYIICPVSFVLTMMQYTVLASSLTDMPPAQEAHVLGPNVMLAWFLCALSAGPILMTLALGGSASLEEERNEQLVAQKQFMQEAAHYSEYGAAGGASGGAAGGDPRFGGAGGAGLQGGGSPAGWSGASGWGNGASASTWGAGTHPQPVDTRQVWQQATSQPVW